MDTWRLFKIRCTAKALAELIPLIAALAFSAPAELIAFIAALTLSI